MNVSIRLIALNLAIQLQPDDAELLIQEAEKILDWINIQSESDEPSVQFEFTPGPDRSN